MTLSESLERQFWQEPTRWPVADWGPPAMTLSGPTGLCWHNARTHTATDPDLLLYAEGLVWMDDHHELHGWVVERTTNNVVETTGRYASAERYRGMAFDVRSVDAFLDDGRRTAPLMLNGAVYSMPGSVVGLLFDDYDDGIITGAGFARALRTLSPVAMTNG